MGRIEKQKPQGHGRIKAPEEPRSTNHESPVFCLRYLKSGYTLDECGAAEAQAFVSKLKSLCDLDWQTIQNSNRRGQGHEKITVKEIKPDMPRRVTADVTELICFRFPGGDTARFLGLRHGRVFEVYFIDPRGEAYDHGE